MIKKYYFITAIIISICNPCLADSIPEYLIPTPFERPHIPFENITDTNLTGFQNYDPAFIADPVPQFAGNLGAVMINNSRNIEQYHQENSGLYALAQNEFSPFSQNRNLIYNRFSKLNYEFGSKQNQQLQILHHQRVAKGFTAGIDFKVLAAPGFYSRQLNKHRNLDVFTVYKSSDYRYNLEAHYISNKLESEENGGIINDSLFIKAANLDANLVGINLNDASSRFQSRIYSLEHSFGLLKARDSSARKHPASKYHFRLHHQFMIERTHRIFQANLINREYFTNYYSDSTRTKDSLFLQNHIHNFGLSYNSRFNLNAANIHYKLFANSNRHEYRYYRQDGEASLTMYDFSVGTEVLLNSTLGVKAVQTNGIENSDERKFMAEAALSLFDNKAGFFIRYTDELARPTLISRNFSSNHFRWDIDLSQSENSSIEAGITLRDHLFISGRRTLIRNYVYFDQEGLPQQFRPEIIYQHLDIQSKQEFGKFRFRQQLRLQDTDHPYLIRIPDFSIYASTFYETILFEKRFPLQFGFDWRYNTSYYALEYNPATMQFQLQDEQEVGNYLYVDFFVNFKIKTAMIFFKLEHANEGLSDRDYFLLPYQPMPGRAFRFGLEWRFYD